MNSRVLVTVNVPLEQFEPLKGISDLVMPNKGFSAATREWVLNNIGDCSGVLSQGELRVDAELLDAAPELRIVANAAMGIDNLDREELARRGVAACNTPDAFAESTADLTIGLLLALTRRIAETDRFVRTGEWERRGAEALRWEGTLMGGKTLGLIGYGRIAKMVEHRARAFGMTVLHTRSSASDHPDFRSLDDLLAGSDVVVVLVPLTETTYHLIDSARIAKMKPGAFFINIARGKVMDETAVVAALESGHLAGAGLDVFENEPAVHPALLTMDNVVLTPHTGGATREQRERGRFEAAAEVARFLRGEELLNPV
jgi:glyoxylate reductase